MWMTGQERAIFFTGRENDKFYGSKVRKREICTYVDDPQTLAFHALFVLVGNDEAILHGTDAFRSIPAVRCWCPIVPAVLLRLGLVWYLSVLMILLPVVPKVIYTWRQAFLRCMVVRFDFTVSYCSAYPSTIYYFALESLHQRFFSFLKKKVLGNLASVFQVITSPLVLSYDCEEAIDSIQAFASKIESSIKCLQ